MHLRQLQGHQILLIAAKLKQLLNGCGIIQVTKTTIGKFPFCFDTRAIIEIIVIAKIILVEQQIYLFATLATKCFLVFHNRLCAGIAAMVTMGCYIFYYCDNFKFKGLKKRLHVRHAAATIRNQWAFLTLHV